MGKVEYGERKWVKETKIEIDRARATEGERRPSCRNGEMGLRQH